METSHVREALNEWNPIPGGPPDEYDCLVDHVVSALHRGVDASGLAQLIESEFRDHFGVEIERVAALPVAQKLSEWWHDHKTS